MQILANCIHDVWGDAPGAGYGIAVTFVDNVLIRDSELRRIDRHSIYMNYQSPHSVVANNLIVKHGNRNGKWQAAIVVARTSEVSVIANRVVNSHYCALSVEGHPDYPSHGIQVVGNRIIGTDPDSPDIWINPDSTTRVVLWGNEADSILCSGIVVNAGCLSDHRIEEPSRWSGTQAIRWRDADATLAKIYVMQANRRWSVDVQAGAHPNDWSVSPIGSADWVGFQDMAVQDGVVYVVRNAQLYEVYPSGDSTRSAPQSWPDFKAMTIGEAPFGVYLIQADALYRVNPSDWSFVRDTTLDWSAATRMVRGMPPDWWNGSYLFVQRGPDTYQINPHNLYATPIDLVEWAER